MSREGFRGRGTGMVVAALLATSMLVSCSSSDGDAATTASVPATDPAAAEPEKDCAGPDAAGCSLRELADARGILIGSSSGLKPEDPQYGEVLAREFNTMSPENALKWDALQATRGTFTFEEADALIDWAEEHDMLVRGHTLLWDQEKLDSTPAWVLEITDPDELWAVVEEHVTTVLDHFRGRVDRWDVVNEPIEASGAAPYENHFHQVLGADWIARVFELAHQVDPDVKLFTNENLVELMQDKAAALVDLVQGLVDDGVPIHGVGIQTHLVSGVLPEGGISDLVATFSDMGLEVALTEVDVPLWEDDPEAKQTQVDTYRQLLAECFDGGCTEVTFWGFTDRYTWLDGFMRPDLAPLLFDKDYAPKATYDAVAEVLIAQAPVAE